MTAARDRAVFDLDPAEQSMYRLSAAVRMHADEGAPAALRRTGLSDGIDAIDDLIRELHKLRAAMSAEARRFDDETARRFDQRHRSRS